MATPSGWIATHESGKVIHFSIEHGWSVEAVTERIAKRCLRDEVLELLAHIAETKIYREPGHDGRFEGYGSYYGPKTPLEIADEIRSLKANP